MHEKRIFSKDVRRQLSLLEVRYNNNGAEIENLVSKLQLERGISYKCLDQLKKLCESQLLEIEIIVSTRGKYFF